MTEQELCECIRKATREANLVPWMQVHSETITLAAEGTPARRVIKLEPREHTRAFVAIIQPRPAPAEGDIPAAMFQVMSQDTAKGANTALLAGNGRIIPAGGDYTHAIPRWAREWWIDLLGVLQGAAGTPAAATVDLVVYEMVSAEMEDRC